MPTAKLRRSCITYSLGDPTASPAQDGQRSISMEKAARLGERRWLNDGLTFGRTRAGGRGKGGMSIACASEKRHPARTRVVDWRYIWRCLGCQRRFDGSRSETGRSD